MGVCLHCTYSMKWAWANECKWARSGVLWGNGHFALKVRLEEWKSKWMLAEHDWTKIKSWDKIAKVPFFPYCSHSFCCFLVKQLEHKNNLLYPSALPLMWQKKTLSPGCRSNICTINHKFLCCIQKWPAGEAAKLNVSSTCDVHVICSLSGNVYIIYINRGMNEDQIHPERLDSHQERNEDERDLLQDRQSIYW